MPTDSVLSYAVSYDGLHYLTNFYQWEKNYAFLPGYVTFIRLLERALQWITFRDNVNVLLVFVLVVVNKVLTAVSAAYLYRIAWKVTDSVRVGRAAALVFLFNPASIFYHAVYSEPLYCCVTFAAIFAFLDTKQAWSKALDRPLSFFRTCGSSLALMSLSVGIRSTTMFLALVPGLPLLNAFWASLRALQFGRVLRIGFVGAATLLAFMGVFIVYLYYGYWQFCSSDPKSWFCSAWVPNVYSAVQDKFWHVGFLKYYHADRALMIIFGLYSIFCALLTAFNGLYKKQPELCVSYWILMFVTIGYSNVQSSARFFSSHPIYSINLALFLSQDKRASPRFKQSFILYYLMLYNIMGVIFFSVRIPWT